MRLKIIYISILSIYLCKPLKFNRIDFALQKVSFHCAMADLSPSER